MRGSFEAISPNPPSSFSLPLAKDGIRLPLLGTGLAASGERFLRLPDF